MYPLSAGRSKAGIDDDLARFAMSRSECIEAKPLIVLQLGGRIDEWM